MARVTSFMSPPQVAATDALNDAVAKALPAAAGPPLPSFAQCVVHAANVNYPPT